MAKNSDSPIERRAVTIADLWSIVTHPAFRIGFLDARAGRPFDHDRIFQRIQLETPAGSLKRGGWSGISLFAEEKGPRSVTVSQIRYEEGRFAFLIFRIGCKAWGHPDFPPVQIRDLVYRLAEERRSEQFQPTKSASWKDLKYANPDSDQQAPLWS